jgi:hypothetical protein
MSQNVASVHQYLLPCAQQYASKQQTGALKQQQGMLKGQTGALKQQQGMLKGQNQPLVEQVAIDPTYDPTYTPLLLHPNTYPLPGSQQYASKQQTGALKQQVNSARLLYCRVDDFIRALSSAVWQ